MNEILMAALLGGTAHFATGGVWYNVPMISRAWLQGFGITSVDLRESNIGMGSALLASGAGSFGQAAMLAILFTLVGEISIWTGALVGAGLAVTFGVAPILRDKVWADRPWSLFLIDSGHEVLSGAAAGAAVAWWLG